MKRIHEITADDVGKKEIPTPPCRCCGASGKPINLADALGVVQEHDIGKRVYRYTSGTLAVESDAQRKRRKEMLFRKI